MMEEWRGGVDEDRKFGRDGCAADVGGRSVEETAGGT
jgi:hypothetical protein